MDEGKITTVGEQLEKIHQNEDRMHNASLNTPRLKNEFRDEVQDPYAGIPEAELVTRDQAVLLKEMRFNKYVTNINQEISTKATDAAKALVIELSGMPKSPYREICMENLKVCIKNNLDHLKTIGFPISKELNLRALEELFAGGEPGKPEDVEDNHKVEYHKNHKGFDVVEEDKEAEDELTIPEDSEGPGEGVDDDANPEEVI